MMNKNTSPYTQLHFDFLLGVSFFEFYIQVIILVGETCS